MQQEEGDSIYDKRQKGGCIRFNFQAPIDLVDLRLLDIDSGIVMVTGLDMNGNEIATLNSPDAMGGNSLWSANKTNAADIPQFVEVLSLDVCFPPGNAGAIAAVAFCIDDDDLIG